MGPNTQRRNPYLLRPNGLQSESTSQIKLDG